MSETGLFSTIYNPDVLSCLANLSSDEVFTPPQLANDMLDLLPQEIFSDPNTKILDPACKSGVFLREAAKRYIKGLENQIPNLQERIDHIFHNQLFGIAITDLTSLLSRRSVYCSKHASSPWSVCKFDDADGNILFPITKHVWEWNKCKFCGASKDQYDRAQDLESHAYAFIHTSEQENNELFERLKNMHFDVIIGNPPYQLSDGGFGASAKPIYQFFVQQAKKLQPRYISMIIPSRWMTGGKGLDEFRDEMLEDQQFKVLHDYVNCADCFPGVDIKGGVCYFLWENRYDGECNIFVHDTEGVDSSKRYLKTEGCNTFIRYSKCISIIEKVGEKREEKFSQLVSVRKPYGFCTDFLKFPQKYGYPDVFSEPVPNGIKLYGLENLKRVVRYLPKDYPISVGKDTINKYKIFIPNAYGCGAIGENGPTPILATPMSCCTETFLRIGSWTNEQEAKNALSYLQTKFFRLLVGIKKTTQHTSVDTYSLVPLQDFTQEWTDEKLYKKYGLTQDEIDFIESMIKPME